MLEPLPRATRFIFLFSLILLQLLCASFRWPLVDGRITSTFGESRWDHLHDGIDMIAPTNAVHPIARGRLVYAWDRSLFPLDNYPGGGNVRILEHDGGIYSVYMHCDDSPRIKALYEESEPVAIMGNTGRSLGRHLHFSILMRKERTSVNPFKLLPAWPDGKAPVIGDCAVRIEDRYFPIKNNSNIRLTKHYPLLVEIFDSERGNERLGVYRLIIALNGKVLVEADFTKIGIGPGGLHINGKTYDDVFDQKGYYKALNATYTDGINTVKITAADYAGNVAEKEISFNVKLETPETR
ncbi:MAG TPA: M23 family metallopeptidase [Spirochaetota bacterium]|nr:M23 family metallopeptidase [Spirochaetota bacterium]HNT10400.1 M23 family metallopeptidase [Spirochaetota bacterium]HNV46458.1 M23 family metallopeptidase [Spirochaetota bacterium]HOS39471.1 M23 family metallopeptidase [Spirochaetota bacterium]HPI22578.1 M23 family metallopeptidase [Spirochaetota bacterium]